MADVIVLTEPSKVLSNARSHRFHSDTTVGCCLFALSCNALRNLEDKANHRIVADSTS